MADSPHSAGSPQVARAVDRTPTQIPLALDYAPAPVRAHGLCDAHWRPLAGWARGGPSFRTTAQLAWGFPLLELDRTGNSYAALGLDVDGRENVISFMDAVLNRRLPEPNITVERLRSGNIQAHYFLAAPVHRGPGARRRPIRALVRVSEYLTETARADHGYTGVLSRNPMEDAHVGPLATDGPCRTIWGRREPYALSELTRIVPLGWKRPTVVASSDRPQRDACSRTLMRETGKPANWGKPVLPLALAVADAIRKSMHGDHPFTDAEVHSTAASVERYQRRNLASGATQAGLAGAPGGTWAAIREGAPDGAASRRRQPWKAAGVSRATWYRRRAQDAQMELLNELRRA